MLTASCLRRGFRVKYNCFPVLTLTPGGDGRIRLKVAIDTTFDSIHLAGFRERPISVPALAPGEWMDSAENLGAFYLYRIRLDELHFQG